MRAWLIVLILLPWIAHSRCAIEGLYQPKSDSEKTTYLKINADGNFEQRDSSGDLLALGKVEEISPAFWEVESKTIQGPIKQKSKTIMLSDVEYTKVPESAQPNVLALFGSPSSERIEVSANRSLSGSSNGSTKSETNWIWIGVGAVAALIVLLVATR